MKKKYRIKLTLGQAMAIILFTMVVLFAVCPSVFAPYDPLTLDVRSKLQGPSAVHLFGTDELGRDILSRIIHGTRPSILVGFGTAMVALLLGVPLGLVSGYYGGVTDGIIMRVMDAFQSFPSMLLAILMMTVFEPSIEALIATISLVEFPRFARLVRGSVLSIKNLEYIESAKASGAKPGYLMFRAILPNCVGNIIAQFSLLASTAILIEAGLSFLGFGIQPPEPSWGSMLSYAKQYVAQSFSYIAGPTLTIYLVVMSINTIGDLLQKTLDPYRKRR